MIFAVVVVELTRMSLDITLKDYFSCGIVAVRGSGALAVEDSLFIGKLAYFFGFIFNPTNVRIACSFSLLYNYLKHPLALNSKYI